MEKTIHFTNIALRVSTREVKHKSVHYHPDVLELLFVIDGSAAATIGQRSTFVKQGEFFVINSGQLHSIHCCRSSTCVSVFFDLNHYRERYPHIDSVSFISNCHNLSRAERVYWKELRNYFIRLMLMYHKNTFHAQKVMQDLADKIVQLLWQHFQDRKELAPQSMERYYNILSYLNNHYKEEISVTQVAKEQGISVTRLAHFWKAATGGSIRQAITTLRLCEAERMLLKTQKTISDIALQCGFSDEKYFYHHFKTRHLLTPNEFRIHYQEKEQGTVRVLLSRREGERRFQSYAMNYYTPDLKPSLEGQSQEELDKEETLEYLYNAVVVNPDILLEQVATTGQLTTYLYISPGKALFRRQGEYEINWEYVYALMHVYVDRELNSQVIIDYDSLDGEDWEELLIELIEELKMIWGKKVVEAQRYTVSTKVVQEYVSCIDLIDYLLERTPIKNANAIFSL